MEKFSSLMMISLIGSLFGPFIIGINFGFSSPALIGILNDKIIDNIYDPYYDWISSIVNLSAMFGAFVAGPISGKIGIKWSLILVSIPNIIGWSFISWGKERILLLAGRFFAGFSVGFFSSVVPAYIIAISSVNIRGLLGSTFQIAITFGAVYSTFVAIFLNWRYSAIAHLLCCIIMPLIMIFASESPFFLFSKYGNNIKVLKSFQKIRNNLDVSEEIDEISKIIQSKPKMFLSWEQMKQRKIYKSLFLSVALMLFQQFSGISGVIFNQVEMFEAAKINLKPIYCALIVLSFSFFTTVISAVTCDRFGRKTLLLVSEICQVISLGIIATSYLLMEKSQTFSDNFSWLILIGCIAYVTSFSIGWGAIPWILIPELTPNIARGFVLAVATAINWISAFLITQQFHNFYILLHSYGIFYGFMTIGIIGIVFIIYCLPETRGKTQTELESLFESENQSNMMKELK